MIGATHLERIAFARPAPDGRVAAALDERAIDPHARGRARDLQIDHVPRAKLAGRTVGWVRHALPGLWS